MASYISTVSYDITQVTDDQYKLYRVVECTEHGDFGECFDTIRRTLLTTGDIATVTRLYGQLIQEQGDEVGASSPPPTNPAALDNVTLTTAIHDLEARLMIVEAELAERKQQEIATPSVAKSFRQYAINTMGRLIR